MNTDFLTRAISLFLLPEVHGPFIFSQTEGGINNFVYYCDCGGNGTRVVLRVYNNGSNFARVQFEHMILSSLNDEASCLPFRIPTPIPTIADPSLTYSMLDDIPIAVFELIPGVNPEVKYPFSFGKAAGELSVVMARITSFIAPKSSSESVFLDNFQYPTKPYFDLYGVHSAVNKDSFYSTLESSAFDDVRDLAEYFSQRMRQLEQDLEAMMQCDWLMQIIHGDLVYNNVLVDSNSGEVTGLIDFEFVALDWRAMDLAICLSKYANQPNVLDIFDEFLRGYSLAGVLTAAEAEALPQLIALRLLSNVVYFTGRMLAGEDTIITLVERMKVYIIRLQILHDQRDEIVRICKKHFKL